MKKTLIFLFIGIFLMSLASATTQESLGTFKQGDCVDLKQGCASCSYVNFTRVIYPNGTQALGNVQADKDGSIFNYTFCDASALGKYIVYGIGDVDSTDTVFAYTFDILSQDKEFKLQDIIFIIFLIIIFFAVLFGSYKLTQMQPKYTLNALYRMRQNNIFAYYYHLGLRNNMHLIGYFGIYISLFLIANIINLSLYSLGLIELSELSKNIVLLLAWGLIPFTIFWFIWLIITFYTNTIEIFRYQFGGFKEKK